MVSDFLLFKIKFLKIFILNYNFYQKNYFKILNPEIFKKINFIEE
jgi:hypothetical protein